MSAANKELCQKNYPQRWTLEMVKAACEKGKITEREYKEITNKAYDGEPHITSGGAAEIEARLSQSDDAVIELYEMILGLLE